jgi:hypothetical protein
VGLDAAHDFVDKHDVTFTMLWDESFIGWQALGVTSTPTALVLAPDGTPLAGWLGAFPEDEVLDLAAQYTNS